jgi:hypothetical protein
MRVAIGAVRDTGALCEGAICYTADPFDPSRPKYNLQYYVNMAKELERAGVNIWHGGDGRGENRPEGRQGRSAGADRGDEDGDHDPRRTGGGRQACACAAGTVVAAKDLMVELGE